MPSPTTEELHAKAVGLDQRPLAEVARILTDAQVGAAAVVQSAIPAICDGAHLMAVALRGGGRLFYIGAGSSGLMAAADALELGGTFGVSSDRLRILMAGGLPNSPSMPGTTEDDTADLAAALSDIGPGDVSIAVAASGTTPYTVNAATTALARGAKVIGLANNAGTPLLEVADVAILLQTPPEVLSGSTRLGAGTAQKIALNTMSTLMGVRLGHVYDGMMVNLLADNDKLRRRAAGMVQKITAADPDAALEALNAAEGDVKLAVLIAAGQVSLAAARDNLKDNNENLRGALDRLRNA